MENKMLPLLQGIIGIAVTLFGVLVCIAAYLRAKAQSKNQE